MKNHSTIVKNIAFIVLYLFLLISCKREIAEIENLKITRPRSLSTVPLTTKDFQGLHASDLLTDPLRNPERGFRSEFMVYAHNRNGVFSDNRDFSTGLGNAVRDYPLLQMPEGVANDSLTLAQFYIYLTQEALTDLSSNSLNNIQYFFDELKAAKIKAVLRFAYDGTPLLWEQPRIPYSVQNIQRHLTQLKPILLANKAQIPVIQAGFVGDWGEWGDSYYKHANYADGTSVIVKSILNALNNERQILVRYPSIKNKALSGSTTTLPYTTADYNRTGFCNDFFTTGLQAPNSDFPIGSTSYNQERDENKSSKLWMDGEIPYYSDGTGTYDFNKTMNVMTALRILSEHRYTSFSMRDQRTGGIKNNLQIWRNTQISLQDIINSGYNTIPRDTAYFKNANGVIVTRSVYDFVRDHLGYRFQFQQVKYPSEATLGSNISIQIRLTNKGFSNLINSRDVYLALVDDNNDVTTIPLDEDAKNWDVSTITPSYTINKTIKIPEGLANGNYKIGLWLPDKESNWKLDADYAIKFANKDLTFWKDAQSKYLINVFGTINLQDKIKNYSLIRNRWQTNSYLYDDGSNLVKYGISPTGNTAYRWLIEDVGEGFIRFKNIKTGNYMHVMDQTGKIQSGAVGPLWWSAMWKIDNAVDGWSYIKNRWQPNQWIHIENTNSYAEYNNSTPTWWSVMWKIENFEN